MPQTVTSQSTPKRRSAPYRALLERATRGRRPTREEVEAILACADPRPLLALLERDSRWKQHRDWLPGRAYRRATESLQRGGFSWNEILDRLSQKNRWPTHQEGVSYVTDHASRAGSWARQQKSDTTLLECCHFSCRSVMREVLRQAGVVTPRLVDALRERPELWEHLAENPNLRSEAARRLRDHALELAERSLPRTLDEPWDQGRGFAQAGLVLRKPALSGLLTAAEVQRFLGWSRRPLPGKGAEQVRWGLAYLFGRVYPQVEPEDAAEVAALLFHSHWSAATVAGQVNAPLPLLRALARLPRAISVWRALARNPRAQADPEICDILSRSRSLKIAEQVLPRARGSGFRQSFRVVSEKKPLEAFQVLERRGDGAASTLRPQDLAPVLAQGDAETRERAMRLVGSTRRNRR